MPARARMMPISHGTACSAVVGLRRLPSRFGSQASDGPESGGPPKAVVAAAVSRATWSPGSCSASNSGSGSGSLGNRFRLRFVDGWGRGQLIRDLLSGDGGRGHLRSIGLRLGDRFRLRFVVGWGRSQLIPRLAERRWRPRPSPFDRARARHRVRSPAPSAPARAVGRRASASGFLGLDLWLRLGLGLWLGLDLWLGSSATIGSASAGCSRLSGLLRGRLLRLRPRYRSTRAGSRTGVRSAPARTAAARCEVGWPRHRPGAGWRAARRDQPPAARNRRARSPTTPPPGVRRMACSVAAARRDRGRRTSPLLALVPGSPPGRARASSGRLPAIGSRSRGPAGRSAHPAHDSEPSGDGTLGMPRDANGSPRGSWSVIEPRVRQVRRRVS